MYITTNNESKWNDELRIFGYTSDASYAHTSFFKFREDIGKCDFLTLLIKDKNISEDIRVLIDNLSNTSQINYILFNHKIVLELYSSIEISFNVYSEELHNILLRILDKK